MAISMDDALTELGGFGLFQWLLLLASSFVQCNVTFQILLLSFIAAEPKWSCVNASTLCNVTGSFGVGDDNYDLRCDLPRSEWYFRDDFTSIVTEFDLVCGDSILATVTSTLVFIGWLISSFIFGYIADKFGRKVALLYCIANTSLVPLAGAFANSLWLFTIFRILAGTGIGAGAPIFVLLTEYTSVKHRGTTGLVFWFSWIFGYMTLALIAFLVRDWRHLTIVTSALGLPGFIIWWFFPESVRWFLVKNRAEKAKKQLESVARCNKRPMIKEDLIKPGSGQNMSFRDLFSTPIIRKYTLLSSFIWIVNAAVYYGVSFSSVSLGGNMYLNFFISAVVEIPANIIALLLLNRIGRKPCVLYGMLIACFMSIGAVVCQIYEKEEAVSDGYWVARVFLSMGAKLAITVSFNTVWVWSNELFPTVVRSLGMGLTSSLARIGSFSSGYIIWLARVHVLIPYAIFAALALMATIACHFLPETMNQPTVEVIEFNEKTPNGEAGLERGVDNVVVKNSLEEENMTNTSKL